MNIFRFAFRNVLRYRTRTIFASFSIFIASLIVVFAQGYVGGITTSMTREYKDYLTGDLKITTEGFIKRENFIPVDEIMKKSIIETIDTIKGIKLVEPRFRFGTLLGKDENIEPAIGIGLNFENTRFRIIEKLVEGDTEGLVITRDFSKKLGIGIGDSILIVSRTSEGGINGIKLKVSGIVHFGIGLLDKNLFFIPINEARRLLKIKEGFTEILIYSDDKRIIDKIRKLNLENVSIRTPGEQIPFIDFFKTAVKIYSLLELFIALLSSFVILNLMTMIVFERLREIGTLKAIGMKDNDIFKNFILEGTIIGSIGGILGSFLGFLILFWTHNKGINFESAIKNTDLIVSYILYPDVRFYYIIVGIIISIFVSAIASMLPSLYAKRFTPYEALRKI